MATMDKEEQLQKIEQTISEVTECAQIKEDILNGKIAVIGCAITGIIFSFLLHNMAMGELITANSSFIKHVLVVLPGLLWGIGSIRGIIECNRAKRDLKRFDSLRNRSRYELESLVKEYSEKKNTLETSIEYEAKKDLENTEKGTKQTTPKKHIKLNLEFAEDQEVAQFVDSLMEELHNMEDSQHTENKDRQSGVQKTKTRFERK